LVVRRLATNSREQVEDLLMLRGAIATQPQVLADRVTAQSVDLAVGVGADHRARFIAVHRSLPDRFAATARSSGERCSSARARASRDITVPIGTAARRASSSYDSRSSPRKPSTSRYWSGTAAL